jgi:hypothetical protein
VAHEQYGFFKRNSFGGFLLGAATALVLGGLVYYFYH